MRNCSITSFPFYDSPNAVVIPILIRKKYVETAYANENAHPFPIAVRGEFSEDFYIRDKQRGDVMMDMISSVMGRSLTWEEFDWLRGDDKVVTLNEKEYIIDFFACHEHVFDSVLNDLKVLNSYNTNKMEMINFTEYQKLLKNYVATDPIAKMARGLKPQNYVDTLPSNLVSHYTIPDNFKEEHLDYMAEVRFMNAFLNMTGKVWTKSMHVPYEEDCEDAFNVLKGMFKKF